MIGEGFPINWAVNPANVAVTQHPLYTKYNLKAFNSIDVLDVKADLNGLQATAGSAAIAAYLSWLLRTKALLA